MLLRCCVPHIIVCCRQSMRLTWICYPTSLGPSQVHPYMLWVSTNEHTQHVLCTWIQRLNDPGCNRRTQSVMKYISHSTYHIVLNTYCVHLTCFDPSLLCECLPTDLAASRSLARKLSSYFPRCANPAWSVRTHYRDK